MSPVFRDVEGQCLAPRGSVVAIGAFDGVHRGHRILLERVRERATALSCDAIALSFEPLPRQHFGGRASVPRLSTPYEKARLLCGFADRVGFLRFDARLASVSADAFVARVLVQRLAMREVWVGREFRFGQRRMGDFNLLHALGARYGYAAHAIDVVVDGTERISATAIRAALLAGELGRAERMLGRRYAMSGRVVRGNMLGRKLGFPTANVRMRFGVAPVRGIYAVRISGAGLAYAAGVASVGTRPTVGGIEPLLEAHVFDFDGDLYARRIEVEFVAKLRDEERFETLEAMIQQMHRDAARARAVLAENPGNHA
ncbi:MAG TPA: bifunctional riboflavin kinase/FAD synthetase [Candidatus Saccharimonadia bacterium]|nr:bifunctional riboflavin kinase/FAD synthetase [Candidatus Saccharimonadia bacterium]